LSNNDLLAFLEDSEVDARLVKDASGIKNFLISKLTRFINAISAGAYSSLKVIGNAAKSVALSTPILKSLPIFQTKGTDEEELKRIANTITTGNALASAANIFNMVVTKILHLLKGFRNIPGLTDLVDWLAEIIHENINFNNQQDLFRYLYRIMKNANMPEKFIRTHLTLLALMVPFYTLINAFKTAPHSYKEFGGELDLEREAHINTYTHPFQGQQSVSVRTGLNQVETILVKNVNKVVQQYKNTEGTLDASYRLSIIILKQACAVLLSTIFLLASINVSRLIASGNALSNMFHFAIFILQLIVTLYYLFFVTVSVIMNALAIEEEELDVTDS
jgi:hypothetical protein